MLFLISLGHGAILPAGMGAAYQGIPRGVAADELWASPAAFMIPEDDHMIRLGDVPVVFVRPWAHPGFTVVLGTSGMRRIGRIAGAGVGHGQLIVVQR
jgi:hypothetical protein